MDPLEITIPMDFLLGYGTTNKRLESREAILPIFNSKTCYAVAAPGFGQGGGAQL